MRTINYLAVILILFSSVQGLAQVGIATASPNSRLEVAGSLATNYRSFTGDDVATASDNILLFSGILPRTITLPSAVGCNGRRYYVKNASGNNSVLTIQPALSQTIDGAVTWMLDEPYESVLLVSTGTNWSIATANIPTLVTGLNWSQNGNNLTFIKSIGTINNYDLPFITNNTEKMRLMSTGGLALGATTLTASNPEKLLVDAGTLSSVNVISGRGSIDNYLQLNIQNRSSGNTASSDIVASANNGSETANFIDLGINSSGFSNTAYPILDGSNNAYLYATGNDFIIGNGTAAKNLSLFAGGFDASNEHLRITGTGNVGIGNLAPTEKLDVEGNIRLSGLNNSLFFDASVDPYAGIKNIARPGETNELMIFSGNDVSGSYGADRIRLASNELHFATSPVTSAITSGDPTAFYENTTDVPTRLFINQNGNTAIGATSFNGSAAEKLLVDAGNTSSFNVISGKGDYNNYLQLNIQNNSGGNSASSDIVATADNGTESTKFVNLGINSSGYTSSGITGGGNNAYLFTTGNDFVIGTSTDDKSLIFYTSTAGSSSRRMSITSAGLIPALNNSYALGSTTRRYQAAWAVNGTIQTSDRRVKENIIPLKYGLAEILQLDPVSYNWKDEKDPDNKIGLIAQQVKEIIPEAVSGDKSEWLGVNYNELIPVLINAIQELKMKTNELRTKAKNLHLIN